MHRPGGAAQEIRFYKARTAASGPFNKPAGKIDQIAAAQKSILLNLACNTVSVISSRHCDAHSKSLFRITNLNCKVLLVQDSSVI